MRTNSGTTTRASTPPKPLQSPGRGLGHPPGHALAQRVPFQRIATDRSNWSRRLDEHAPMLGTDLLVGAQQSVCTRLGIYKTFEVKTVQRFIVMRWLKQWLTLPSPPPSFQQMVDSITTDEELRAFFVAEVALLNHLNQRLWTDTIEDSLRGFTMHMLWAKIGDSTIVEDDNYRRITADVVAYMVSRIRQALQWNSANEHCFKRAYHKIMEAIENELNRFEDGWQHQPSANAIQIIREKITEKGLSQDWQSFVLAHWSLLNVTPTIHFSILPVFVTCIPIRNESDYDPDDIGRTV